MRFCRGLKKLEGEIVGEMRKVVFEIGDLARFYGILRG